VLAAALFIDPVAHGVASQRFILVAAVLPTKWQAIETALFLPPTAMVYAYTADAIHAIREAVGALAAAPPAALVLTTADVFDLEPLPAGAPGWYQDLAGANAAIDAITFASLADSSNRVVHLSFFEHIFFGRCTSAARDPPGNPVRQALSQLGPLCAAAGIHRSGAGLPG
jgi:hypothetical protein